MNTWRRDRWLLGIALGLLLPAAGCHQYLVETPNLLLQQDPAKVYASCPPNCQTPDAPILYATDRAVDSGGDKNPVYGYCRANTLAFGVANISLNPHPTWKELIEASTQSTRSKDYELKLASVSVTGQMK